MLSATGEAPDEFNARRALNREEWLAFMLQAAIARYVTPEKLSVVDGIQQLFTKDIYPNLNVSCLHDANRFREEQCYRNTRTHRCVHA